MMQRKPLALTMMALFATPLAIPCSASAAAQGGAVSEATTVAEAATSGTTPAAPAATLPQTDVSGASIRDEYQRDMATVGGKVPTAIRDIPIPEILLSTRDSLDLGIYAEIEAAGKFAEGDPLKILR